MSETARGGGRWRSRAALLLGGTAAGLVLCELAVRLLGLAPQLGPLRLDRPYGSFVSSDNPILRYVPNPGVAGINADGFRDRTYPRRKPAGTRRIVVLGDSIGFGYCNETSVLPVEATFPKVLETDLARDPGGVEVLNFSVSGYDTLQEVEFLREKALAWDPDLVLVAYCLNDVSEASLELGHFASGIIEPAPGLALRALLRGSHLFRLVVGRGRALAARWSGPDRDRTVEGFERLRRLADTRHFDVLVVVFPFFRDLENYALKERHESVAARARAYGLPLLDLAGVYREAAGHEDVCEPCCVVHPNETGHAVAARAIADRLRRAGLPAPR